MGIAYNTSIVRDGLVLHLDAANVKSNFTQNLETLSSTFETYNSPTVTSEGCLYDGIDDYSMSESSTFLKWQNWNQISVQLVYKHISTLGSTGSRQYILDFRTSGGLDGALGLFIDGGNQLTLFYNVGDNTYEEPTIYVHNQNQWYHYCFTFDKTSSSNNIKHYINGENIYTRSVNITNAESNPGSRIWIGRYGGSGYLFNGIVNNFAAWQNRILTQEEVQKNFEALRGRYGL